MNEEREDYILQNYYKRKLRLDRYAYAAKILNSQVWCAVRTIKAPMHTPSVIVLANDKQAKFWGVQTCKSPWSCPVCSARKMAKEAARIACAIDALKKRNLAGFMITFSVPHYHDFTCKQVYDILRETWRQFAHQAKSKAASVQHDVFAQFNNAFNCKYRIRVGEFTWGQYSWHPHYHCLFFVDEQKLQSVLDWQERLSDRWHKLAMRATRKVLKRDNSCDDIDKFMATFAEKTKPQYDNEEKIDAFISRDKNGKVLRANSSHYICGWGADKELTGNVRKQASHEGHYTPYQLLNKAYELDNPSLDDPEADKYFKLYVEFAITTFKTFRVRMSPELKRMIQEWQMTNEYIQTYKKKLAEQNKNIGRWKIVCWFKEQQWYDICRLHLDPEIIILAKQTNGKEKIEQFLLEHQIDITQNGLHPDQEFFNSFFHAA